MATNPNTGGIRPVTPSHILPYVAFFPEPATAQSRFLIQGYVDRDDIAHAVEALVELLDTIDGDPDLEPEEDMGEEERGEQGTWSNAIDQRTLSAGCMAWHGNDDTEDDDPSGQCDEDGINTALALAADLGPGCPWADPGEYGEPGI